MNRFRPRAYALLIAAFLSCVSAPAYLAAQAGTATLSGTVIDEQGAAVPGANVTATELATGATRTAASNAEGVFRLAGLPSGRYTVDVTLDGFQPLKVTDVPLAPAEIRVLDGLMAAAHRDVRDCSRRSRIHHPHRGRARARSQAGRQPRARRKRVRVLGDQTVARAL